MKKIEEMWYRMSYDTRSMLEGFFMLLACIVGAALLMWGIVGIANYNAHGDLTEPCYDDQTCTGDLVCTPCRNGCAVTFTCLPK